MNIYENTKTKYVHTMMLLKGSFIVWSIFTFDTGLMIMCNDAKMKEKMLSRCQACMQLQ